MKTKILEWCGGAKADDKAAAEVRWEALKMEDLKMATVSEGEILFC